MLRLTIQTARIKFYTLRLFLTFSVNFRDFEKINNDFI